jgi:hypothetical protein
VFQSGETKKMDQENATNDGNPAPKPAEQVTAAPSVHPPERRRSSLKEFAARASQSGARAGTSTPPPSAGPASVRPSSPSVAPAPPSVAPSRPSVAPFRPSTATHFPRPDGAGLEDSSVINLDVVRAAATPQQIAAAEKAKPAQAGLFDDDHTVEPAVNPAEKAALATAAPVVVAGKKNRTGPIAGAAIVVLGIGAAFARDAKPAEPSQGSVQSAVGAVIGGAKACVTGADAISRAQVTFSSAGTVTNVSVTGWAAAHGKTACVQAALKGAKVGPFSKQSFTIPVPIRP